MDFVHAKPVEATLFYRLWNVMPVHNHHILSHFATVVPSPASVSATVPHKIYLFFSNVLSKGYIQQQEGVQVSWTHSV